MCTLNLFRFAKFTFI